MNEIVAKIQEVREQRKQLENTEKELITSFFTAKCDINEVVKEFVKLKKVERIECLQDKKLFVYVCISLYCPSFFVGDRIKKGTRNKLAVLTGLSCSRISNISTEVRFLYSHYKCFKQEADYLYREIRRSLTS